MEMEVVDQASGTLEILCDHCQAAATEAVHTDQWNFEGLYWDAQIPCDPAAEQFNAYDGPFK
jgi:hypothetical protein